MIEQTALFNALKTRTIHSAGLDVWYQYPDGTTRAAFGAQPFETLDNVVMTPHVGGLSDHAENGLFGWCVLISLNLLFFCLARLEHLAALLAPLADNKPMSNRVDLSDRGY